MPDRPAKYNPKFFGLADSRPSTVVCDVAKFRMVPIEELRPGDNTRIFFEDIEGLAQLMQDSEWIATLGVRPDGEIISGERRYRAAKHLNDIARREKQPIPWPKLPCIVHSVDDDKSHDLTVAENAGRLNLRFIEWARIMVNYREERGLSNVEIGKKTGFAEETVSKYISIIQKLSPKVIERLDNGEQIPIDVLTRIYKIKDHEVQLLRLEQWQGKPVAESENKPVRARTAALSRRKMQKVIKVLEESGATDETIQVAQYLAGMRQTLPHKWHLKLSRSLSRRQPD